MPRILHTADLHLGSPLSGLPEHVAAALRRESFDALARLCEHARSTDALIISGDLFDVPSPPPSVAARTAAILATAEVPVFIAPGNHDFLHRRSPYSLTEFPKNVHIFNADGIQRVALDSFNVYGSAYDSESSGPRLGSFAADPNCPSMLALHCEQAPIPELTVSGVTYAALGHIHRRSEPARAAHTVYAYCGSPFGRGFDETFHPRGAYIVDLADPSRIELVSTNSRRFHDIEVRLAPDLDPLAAVRAALPPDCSRDIIRFRLTGEAAPHSLDTDRLADTLAPLCFHLVIQNETRLPRLIWQRADDDTLAGLTLTLARERQTDELAVRIALAAIDGEEEPV